MIGTTFPHLVEQTDVIGRLQQGLKAYRSGLDEASQCWDKDNTAVQQARQHLADGRLHEAQTALECLQGRTWTDIDSRSAQLAFENAQKGELQRLLTEADKQAESDPFEAVQQIESRAPDYAQLQHVFSGLLQKRMELLHSLETRLLAEADKQAESDPLEAVRQIESMAPDYAQLQHVFSGLLQKRKELLRSLETRLLAEITQIESLDRQGAVVYGDMLLKRSEGLPELESPLFEKVETLKGAVKSHGLRRKEKFAAGILAATVIFGAVAGIATFIPKLRLLEYVMSVPVASALQEMDVIPIFGGLCIVSWIFLIARISGLKKQTAAILPAVRQAINQFQFEIANGAKQGKINHVFQAVAKKGAPANTPKKKPKIGGKFITAESLLKQISALGAASPGDSFTNLFGHRFRWCPSGEFMMGSSVEEQAKAHECAQQIAEDSGGAMNCWNVSDEKGHRVQLTQGYWLGEHAVTQSQWKAVMGRSQREEMTKADKGMSLLVNNWPRENPNVPVCFIQWNDAVEYCKRLTKISAGNIPEGWSYQLPTEAQWERGCRAGTTTATYIGDLDYVSPNNAPILDRIAWYWGNSFRDFPDGGGLTWGQIKWAGIQYDGVCGPREVGLKEPNCWGLKDTLGNVWEWCLDWWAHDYDEQSFIDPSGPVVGKRKVNRGGAFVWNSALVCRASARGALDIDPPDPDSFLCGFRVALVPPKMKDVVTFALGSRASEEPAV